MHMGLGGEKSGVIDPELTNAFVTEIYISGTEIYISGTNAYISAFISALIHKLIYT